MKYKIKIESALESSGTVEEQLDKYLREGYRNRLSEISDKWPGDETDKEFEEMLKDLD